LFNDIHQILHGGQRANGRAFPVSRYQTGSASKYLPSIIKEILHLFFHIEFFIDYFLAFNPLSDQERFYYMFFAQRKIPESESIPYGLRLCLTDYYSYFHGFTLSVPGINDRHHSSEGKT